MQLPHHPYRKFVCGAALAQGRVRLLRAPDSDVQVRLSEAEYQLALLFDGTRDAAALLAAARERDAAVDALYMDRFALRLAESGLLEPGQIEPLPMPLPYDTRRPGSTAVNDFGRGVIPPSSLIGTLTGPSLGATLTRMPDRDRERMAPPLLSINAGHWLWLGRLLNLGLFSRAGLKIALGLSVATFFVVLAHNLDLGRDFVRFLRPGMPAFLFCVFAVYSVNVLVELARAAAIQRYTHSVPRFMVRIGMLWLPQFYTDTGGAAEALPRGQRLRVVGAPLLAELSLVMLAVLVWLTSRRHGGQLPSMAVWYAFVAFLFFFVQINPLSKREGYNLLRHSLNVGDLREHAVYALFGYKLPWTAVRRPPLPVLYLYLGLVALYLVWVIVFFLAFPASWLKLSWGAIGPVLIIAALSYLIYTNVIKFFLSRSNIGEKITVSPLTQPFRWLGQAIGISWRWLVRLVREHKPRGWDWLIIAAIVIVSLLPYPYEPSGEFTVLPNTRADVRAQVAGEVRVVLVKEGELVQAGQVLARLADEDEKAQVSGAEAALVKLQSQLALARSGHKPEEIAASKQQVNTAATKAQFSREEADRLARAFQRKAVSEQDYKHALSVAEVNEQQLIEAKRNLALVSSPTRDEEIKGIEAEIEHQKSALEYARIQLGYTEVRTPLAGRVVSGSLQFAVGDYLQRGQQLASVEDADHVQVEILMPEDDINEIKVGSRAWAKLWGVPNSSFPGRVTRIAPSAQTQPYGKVVRVYMELDRPAEQFKPQMTGYAKVRGHWYPLIMAFIRPILRFILVEFWSWLP